MSKDDTIIKNIEDLIDPNLQEKSMKMKITNL
jgi:hypothetical protein